MTAIPEAVVLRLFEQVVTDGGKIHITGDAGGGPYSCTVENTEKSRRTGNVMEKVELVDGMITLHGTHNVWICPIADVVGLTYMSTSHPSLQDDDTGVYA
jgi:hypothetical protein